MGVVVPTVVRGLEQVRELAGADLGTSGWLEITQERVNRFADATDDHQWIHVDVERAAAGPFGGTIAHGYLTLALVIPLWSELLRVDGVGMSINYGLNRVRFPAPVPVGAKIRLRAQVISVEDASGGGVQLTAGFTVEIEHGEKPAAVAEVLYRYYPVEP
jgi:acyl dehydratase